MFDKTFHGGEALAKATNGALTAPVPVSQTILDPHNLVMVLLVIVAITVANTLMHPKKGAVVVDPALLTDEETAPQSLKGVKDVTPAQRMEYSPILSWAIALMLVAYLVVKLVFRGATLDLGIVIMIFLALGLLLLWLFVWFVGGAIGGLIRGVIALGRKWCYKEVSA